MNSLFRTFRVAAAVATLAIGGIAYTTSADAQLHRGGGGGFSHGGGLGGGGGFRGFGGGGGAFRGLGGGGAFRGFGGGLGNRSFAPAINRGFVNRGFVNRGFINRGFRPGIHRPFRYGYRHRRPHLPYYAGVPFLFGAYPYYNDYYYGSYPAYYGGSCVIRKHRVHTRHGWRWVKRRYCY